MKRALTLFLLLILAAPAFAAGLMVVGDEEFWRGSPPIIIPPGPPTWPEPRPPRHRIFPPPNRPVISPLEVSSTKADVKIRDQVATTKVEQEFYNPNSQRLEGTFLFPVPKGAQIDKFTMLINGKPAEAELLAAEKARSIYEDIVRRQRDPALLEYAGRDLFRVRIFPIEPNERKHVTLSYSQVLKADGGMVSYVLPMNTEKFTAKPVRDLSCKVTIETKRSLKSLYSPSHKVDIKRDGAHRATVGFESTDVRPDTDFQLIYTQEDSDIGVNLLTYKPEGEDGYFLLLASPGVEMKEVNVMPKDVVFVLDTSGSMAGAKLEQAKKALAFCIENLNDDDRFEVLRFSTEVESLFDKLSTSSKENRTRAQKYVADLRPIGGTAIDDALKKALTLRPSHPEHPFVVVFLTDGRPTVGNTNERDIIEHATKERSALARIFCFGIGNDVNTHLLDKIAENSKAISQYVLPEEDIEVKVSSFFSKIKEPVLANPKLVLPDKVHASKIYPSPLPDIFKGEQLVIAGRFTGSGSGAIQVEGTVNGKPRKFAYDVQFDSKNTDNDFIPRLWATRRVGYLLDEMRLHGDNKELKDEITELARKYGIVTPYTAYLINEDEVRRGVPLGVQSVPQLRDRGASEVGRKRFYSMQKDTYGAAAVADSRSVSELKTADAPRAAIVANNYEMLRSLPREQQLDLGRAAGMSGGAAPTSARAEQMAANIEQQTRFVNGRNFFQNGETWVDSQVQAQDKVKAQRVQVQFGTPEYFQLAATNKVARPWLALGRQVQFVSDNTIYEIVE